MAFQFSPPLTHEVPWTTPGRLSKGERLMRHFSRIDVARNVWISDGVATATQPHPLDASTVTRTFYGGHAPYTVTAAEKAILEAAGYTVQTVTFETVVSDSFERDDSTSNLGDPDTGSTWVQHPYDDGIGVLGISSNAMYTSTQDPVYVIATAGTAALFADGYVEGTFQDSTDGTLRKCGVMMRIGTVDGALHSGVSLTPTPEADTWEVLVDRGGLDLTSVLQVTGPTNTTDPVKVKLQIVGTALSVYIDDVLAGGVTVDFPASGTVGCYTNEPNTTCLSFTAAERTVA